MSWTCLRLMRLYGSPPASLFLQFWGAGLFPNRLDLILDLIGVGYENGIGLLIRSGLFGTLSEAARCVAPVLLERAERGGID